MSTKIALFSIYPAFKVFQVWDQGYWKEIPDHDITDVTVNQGFSWQIGSTIFYPISNECHSLKVEVSISNEITLSSKAMRAIVIPFTVFSGTLSVECFKADRVGKYKFSVPTGEYALLCEIWLRDDQEYLQSAQYQENIETGWTEEVSKLTFIPTQEPIEPKVLRIEDERSFPYKLISYDPLNPIYPLYLDTNSAPKLITTYPIEYDSEGQIISVEISQSSSNAFS
jgi:Competence protein J (ComJ)